MKTLLIIVIASLFLVVVTQGYFYLPKDQEISFFVVEEKPSIVGKLSLVC